MFSPIFGLLYSSIAVQFTNFHHIYFSVENLVSSTIMKLNFFSKIIINQVVEMSIFVCFRRPPTLRDVTID